MGVSVFVPSADQRRIAKFLKTLSQVPDSPSLTNPYLDKNKLHNLKVYLNAMYAHRGKTCLLVGEALGFKGGRLTGLPFSSGQLLRTSEHPFWRSLRDDWQLSDIQSENTATMIWSYFENEVPHDVVPLCWNAFPFHPHPPDNPLKNRMPKQTEIKSAQQYLQALALIYQPRQVVGVGNKGYEAAKKAFPEREIFKVRHPSFGGKRAFMEGMAAILGHQSQNS